MIYFSPNIPCVNLKVVGKLYKYQGFSKIRVIIRVSKHHISIRAMITCVSVSATDKPCNAQGVG